MRSIYLILFVYDSGKVHRAVKIEIKSINLLTFNNLYFLFSAVLFLIVVTLPISHDCFRLLVKIEQKIINFLLPGSTSVNNSEMHYVLHVIILQMTTVSFRSKQIWRVENDKQAMMLSLCNLFE